MDPYPSTSPEPAQPRHLSGSARRVDWLVATGCSAIAVLNIVVATVLIGLLTSTCSESGDCDESARSLAFGLGPLAFLIGMAAVVIATVALHRRGTRAWWTGVVALVVITVSGIAAVVIGSGSVPPR